MGTVKGGISREGRCYFYTTFVDGGTTTFGGWVATGSDVEDALAYQQYLQLDTSVRTVEDFVILYDTGTSALTNPPPGFAVVLLSNADRMDVYRQAGEAFGTDPMTDAGAVNVTELMWAWASPAEHDHIPGYAFQTSSGTVFADSTATSTRWPTWLSRRATPSPCGSRTVSTPSTSWTTTARCR